MSGDGAAEARWESRAERKEGVVPLRATPAELARIFDVVIDVGWTGAVSLERQGGEDEPVLRITVTNAAGRAIALERWMGDAHPRFDPVLHALERVRDQLPAGVRKEIAW